MGNSGIHDFSIIADDQLIDYTKRTSYNSPILIHKIIDPHNYLLMTLDEEILRVLSEHERLKPAILRTSEGNVSNLSQLKQMINVGLTSL